MMNTKVALLAVVILSVGLMTNAYAHKAQVIGDYKMEVGWKNEPPIVGKKNAIEIVVTKATSTDKKASTSHDHDSHDHDDKKTIKTSKTLYEESSTNIKLVSTSKDKEHKHDTKTTKSKSVKKSVGVTGLSKTIEADVTLNGKKTFLTLVEDKQHKGTYHGDYTPNSVGYPTVHVVGKVKNTPIEVTFHPEKVESTK